MESSKAPATIACHLFLLAIFVYAIMSTVKWERYSGRHMGVLDRNASDYQFIAELRSVPPRTGEDIIVFGPSPYI
jgi:hypothetical protein